MGSPSGQMRLGPAVEYANARHRFRVLTGGCRAVKRERAGVFMRRKPSCLA